jgi:hypothetical protein
VLAICSNTYFVSEIRKNGTVCPVLEDIRVTRWKEGTREETGAFGGQKKWKGILLKQNSKPHSRKQSVDSFHCHFK